MCPITYEAIPEGEKYSPRGLRLLSLGLRTLEDLAYTAEEQRREAVERAGKVSIQGVQPKLSARLVARNGGFELIDRWGEFILKPQTDLYPELPENEDVTMRLAARAGIEIPLHGLVYSRDGSLTYFIKRFDRIGRRGKRRSEDFSQLSGKTRDTKYDSSMEKVAEIIERLCTFPVLDKVKLFRLTLFSFIVGNEDMHLKNFSLIEREGKIELSPAYDLLNTSIALKNLIEEFALPLDGKKKNISRRLLLDYFGRERLNLPPRVIAGVVQELQSAFPEWTRLLGVCFLSQSMKELYTNMVETRRARIQI